MKEHIYILDDHPIIAEGLAKLLTLEEKYQITIGKHYSELYNYIDNQTPSLLIIDYELQDKTVLELLPYLHKKNSSNSCADLYHAYRILDHKTAHKKRSGRHRYQKR